jgi:hypothetical protein
MARGITATGTTGSVTASGGTLAVNITGLPNYFVITKIKIQPSGGSGPYKVEVFQKDTIGSTDLMGKWNAVAGNLYDPMDNSTGSPAEGNASAFVVVYEDADGTGELHLKFTNNDTSDRTYAYTIVYEETWVFDSGRIASAQKVHLLGTTNATSPTTGTLIVDGGAGIANALWVGGIANIASALTLQSTLTAHGVTSAGATGTGNLVFSTSPTFVTPALGTPSSGNLSNCTALPLGSVTGLAANVATFLGTPSSANLISAVTDETGTGSLVFATSPALVTPLLGTPTSGNLANCTGYPVGSVAGLGSGVATFLGTPSSANLAAAITGETGTGALVFATSPSLTTPDIGAATGTSLSTSGNISAVGGTLILGVAASTGAQLRNSTTDEITVQNHNNTGLGNLNLNAIFFGDKTSTGAMIRNSATDELTVQNHNNTALGDLVVNDLTVSGSYNTLPNYGITINYLDHTATPQTVSF